jgi:hypothetical protein
VTDVLTCSHTREQAERERLPGALVAALASLDALAGLLAERGRTRPSSQRREAIGSGSRLPFLATSSTVGCPRVARPATCGLADRAAQASAQGLAAITGGLGMG